jgi:hypothetical protein
MSETRKEGQMVEK